MKLDRYYMKKNIVDKIKRNKRFCELNSNDTPRLCIHVFFCPFIYMKLNIVDQIKM